MKTLLLGHFAATVAPQILAKVTTPLDSSILDDESDTEHLAPLLADTEIVVGHIWRAGFPPAPRLRCCNRWRRDWAYSTPKRCRRHEDLQRVGHEQPVANMSI